VVPLDAPRRWSEVLNRLLGADFRLLADAGTADGSLLWSEADYVLAPEGNDGGAGLERAVTALIGGAERRPNRYEHAMFLAGGQASRSAGLRGGVGCALLDPVGDVIALGTNEVPRAGGGQYWADSPDDARDRPGDTDPAYTSKVALVQEVLRFAAEGRGEPPDDLRARAGRFVDALDSGPAHHGVVQVLESLGRVVHAELAALASAARHGAAVVGAEAVVTRPPCRQCLRQLIVSGVATVRFLGPADAAHQPFHADALSRDGSAAEKVRLAPFSGVTPRGYGKMFGPSGGPSAASVLARAAGDGADAAALLRAFLGAV